MHNKNVVYIDEPSYPAFITNLQELISRSVNVQYGPYKLCQSTELNALTWYWWWVKHGRKVVIKYKGACVLWIDL